MDFEIIAVGTELLLGQIVNSNAQYISQKISELGGNLFYQTVVGDNPQRLKKALEIASARADIIITTGGLGPTGDDLTKETVAEFCGRKCVPDEESWQRILDRLEGQGLPVPENNRKQAEMPEGCIILPNANGTAPGAVIEEGEKTYIILPGPPSEMAPMFREQVYPYLEKRSDCVIYSKTLRVFGIGESAAEEKLRFLMETQTNPTLAPYAKLGEVTLRLTAKAKEREEAEKMLEPLEKQVRDILGDVVYAEGEENSLQQTLVKLLLEKGKKIAAAESCTGGMLAELITSVPGASGCLDCSMVTYSNEQKQKLLGVSAETLEKYGAVSEQTALEMSKGIRERSGADIGIGITGVAGPGGGTEEKPVGLVYVGICTEQIHRAFRYRFIGSRNAVRTRTCMNAMDLARRSLLDILPEG